MQDASFNRFRHKSFIVHNQKDRLPIHNRLDRDLTAGERLRVRLHLLFCRNCAIVERQFKTIRAFMKHLALRTRNAAEKDN